MALEDILFDYQKDYILELPAEILTTIEDILFDSDMVFEIPKITGGTGASSYAF